MPKPEMLLRLAAEAQGWSLDARLGAGRQAMARTVARLSREMAQGGNVSEVDVDTLKLMTCHLYRHLQPDTTVSACPFGQCVPADREGGGQWYCKMPKL